MSGGRASVYRQQRPLTWSVLWRCVRAPYRRAQQLNPNDYWTLWNQGLYRRAIRSEFDYTLRLYFAPLRSVQRLMGRVVGVIACVTARVWARFTSLRNRL